LTLPNKYIYKLFNGIKLCSATKQLNVNLGFQKNSQKQRHINLFLHVKRLFFPSKILQLIFTFGNEIDFILIEIKNVLTINYEEKNAQN